MKEHHDPFSILTLEAVFYFDVKTFYCPDHQEDLLVCCSVLMDQEFHCCNAFLFLDLLKLIDFANLTLHSFLAADLFCTFQVRRETMQLECVFRLNLPIGFTWISTCKTHQDYLSVG